MSATQPEEKTKIRQRKEPLGNQFHLKEGFVREELLSNQFHLKGVNVSKIKDLKF